MEESFTFIRSYKTDEPIETVEEFPLAASQRIPTDLFCTYASTLFAVVMFIVAVVSFNGEKLSRMTYPTDGQGRHCTLDNSHFSYLYFTSPNDPSKRLCLSQCPKGDEDRLSCWPTDNLSCSKNSNPGFEVDIYPSQPADASLGLICSAKDPLVNKKILENAGLVQMYDFVDEFKSVILAFGISIVLGLVGLAGFMLSTGVMAYASIILGGIGSIVFGIYLLVSESGVASAFRGLVVVFGLIMMVVGALLIYSSIFRQKDIRISIVYLQQATNCYRDFWTLVAASFVFVVLLVGLVALIGFQTLGVWSNAELHFEPNSVYTYPTSGMAVFLTVLNFLQFIWGLSFLKEAFNLVVGATATSWYFDKKHSLSLGLSNLFRFHWGSVVASAFLLHLLYPFDLLYDIFKPPHHASRIYNQICCCCQKVLDLVRSEAMVLVNIAGLPYCNASRWCQKIQYHSQEVDGSQSCSRFLRMGAHMTLSLLGTLVAYLHMSGSVSVLALILSFILNIFAVTFFVCLLQDIAEAIYFSSSLQQYYGNANADSVTKKLFPEGYQILPTES